MRVLFLFALLAGAAHAQHNHGTAANVDGLEVAETFVVTGLRLDETDPPPGSGVGRAGLRYGDGGYVSVVHGKPFVRGRVVWGGLVADGQVWAAGAHQATELVTTVALEVGGTRLEPGAYSLFVTPTGDRWTLHVNTTLGMHLADEYDPALDVVALEVAPRSLEDVVESLTWSFADDGSALVLSWDRRSAAFPISRLP
ncbi:DUF2911 domain-containing protein [Rubrivirga sp.]|uniref:DUF2911 domain-containing protein n=1 Tax=Rubrivirga sp. TaxID=1885344 RepID=UPI003C757609